HAALGHRRHAEAGDVMAVVQDGAGRRRKIFRQKIEQRGLAGPVGADHGVHAVAGKAEVDAIDGEEAAELAAEAAGLQSVNGAIRHASTLLASEPRTGKSGLNQTADPSLNKSFLSSTNFLCDLFAILLNSGIPWRDLSPRLDQVNELR